MKKRNLGLVVGVTTFALFMAEGIIHYNMGVRADEPNKQFHIPKGKALGEIALIVGIFSVLNGVIVNEIKKVI
jgi:hypothetical protein